MKRALMLLCLVEGFAAAKPGGSAQAEVLFDDAKALMAKKQYAAACDKFDSSEKLDPAITTLINAADCREKNNQIATAWGLFIDVERQTRGDASAKQLNKLAQTRAKKLEPRLSKLTIAVAAGNTALPGFTVNLGSDAVLVGSFGSALPVDGGHYTITASATGFATAKIEVDVPTEKAAKTVEIPKLEPAPAGPVVADKPVVEDRVVAVRPTAQHEQPRSHAAAIGVTVAAVALAGGAVGMELWGRSKLDDAGKEPDDAKQASLYDSANTRHYIAQGLGVAAVGAAGLAIYLWVRHPSTSDSTALFVPVASPDHIGFAFTGTFH